jgi:hypothetical protein
MTSALLWTGQWRKKILGFLFQIRLRAVLGGCRNLLRTPARESGTGREPRIRTVRQLAAAAGDGWLGSVGSPGQLETSLNSGYTVGPCNSYLEGPTPIYICGRSRKSRWESPTSSSFAEEKRLVSLLLRTATRDLPDARGQGRDLPMLTAAISDARSLRGTPFPTGARFSRRSQLRGQSVSDPTPAIGRLIRRLVRRRRYR